MKDDIRQMDDFIWGRESFLWPGAILLEHGRGPNPSVGFMKETGSTVRVLDDPDGRRINP